MELRRAIRGSGSLQDRLNILDVTSHARCQDQCTEKDRGVVKQLSGTRTSSL